MAANDRNNPVNRPASDSDDSLIEFMRTYPDDAACLDRLWRDRFAPDGHTTHCRKCGVERRFHRVKSRAAYECDRCGFQIYPMKGTIFKKSTTSLQLWFYAMYLMASTRCGISAKQLERELGVTYKTAWRMMNKIRNDLMNGDDDPEQLSGEVEADESSWGGRPRRKMTRSEAKRRSEAKPTVLGMVERGGKIRARVVPSRRGEGLSQEVRRHINPDAILYTDDWVAYKPLGREYAHRVINHSGRFTTSSTADPHEHDRGLLRNMKTGCAGSTRRRPAAGFSPMLMNTRGATTSAFPASRYSTCYFNAPLSRGSKGFPQALKEIAL